jgi:hypothetical protein
MLDRVEIKQDGPIIRVKVNGQELHRVTSVRYEAEVSNIPMVTLEMYADVDADVEAETAVFRQTLE